MKTIKKIICTIIIILVIFGFVGCKKEEKTYLKVGVPILEGNFIEGFGYNDSDINVRNLLHGYSTVVETEDGEYVWDLEAVLEDEPESSFDSSGNKTYTFKLQEDLKWNNGEKITAIDYVAYLLLYSSKDFTSIAEQALAGQYLVGYNHFKNGDIIDVDQNEIPIYDENYTILDQIFTGVRLLSEYEFSCTIDAKYLPNFFDRSMVTSYPIDLDTYLPGFTIKDDGTGAYIQDIKATGTIEDIIAISINNTNSGQRYKPTVTSGPYQFVSFENKIASVSKNPYYKCNYEGKTPSIDDIHVMEVITETDVNQVIDGTIDIITAVFEGNKINSAKNSETAKMISYTSNNFVSLKFACYLGPTQYPEVRRAIGYLYNREEYINSYLNGQAKIVNGPFGENQWFYLDNKDKLNSQLINYTFDIDKANLELDNSPYKYEADGITVWDKNKATNNNSYYRYNANKEILEINYFDQGLSSINPSLGMNKVSEISWQVGMKVNMKAGTMTELLNHFYYWYNLPEGQRKYHVYSLSSNFSSTNDPFLRWHSSLVGTTNNTTGIADASLDSAMVEMRELNPNNKTRFNEIYVNFADRWNQLLPELPLYSNEYFDIYNIRVTGLKTSPTWSWSDDICALKIVEENE